MQPIQSAGTHRIAPSLGIDHTSARPMRIPMTIDNLPPWPGAAVCYSRAYKWTQVVAARAYHETKDKRRYLMPDDVTAMIAALNVGDEETIKALNQRHIKEWIA